MCVSERETNKSQKAIFVDVKENNLIFDKLYKMSPCSLTIMVNIVSTICHNCEELKKYYVHDYIIKLYSVKMALNIYRTNAVEITMIK